MSTSCPGILDCITRRALVLAGVLVLAGCGSSYPTPSGSSLSPGQAQGMNQETLPSDHLPIGKPAPHPASGNQLKVAIPPEVVAKWNAAELSIRVTGLPEQRLRLSVGDHLKLASTDLTLSVISFTPSFKIAGDTVTSSSDNLENPAVLLELKNPQGKLAEGWVFKKLPEFDTFRSDKVAVTLIKGLQNTP